MWGRICPSLLGTPRFKRERRRERFATGGAEQSNHSQALETGRARVRERSSEDDLGSELGGKRRTAGRDLIEFAVRLSAGSDVAGLGQCRQRNARLGWRRVVIAGVADERAPVGVRVQIAPIGEIVEICKQLEMIALAEGEVLVEAQVALEEIRLAAGIAIEEKRLSGAKLDFGTIVRTETLVTYVVAVHVHVDVAGIGQTAMRGSKSAEGDAPGEFVDAGEFELVGDVQAAAAIIQFQVKRILRSEEGAGVALARSVVHVLREGVVGEELEMPREALVQTGDELVVVAVTKAAELGGLANCGILKKWAEEWVRFKNGPAKRINMVDYHVARPLGGAETASAQASAVNIGVSGGSHPTVAEVVFHANRHVGNTGVPEAGVDVIDPGIPNELKERII